MAAEGGAPRELYEASVGAVDNLVTKVKRGGGGGDAVEGGRLVVWSRVERSSTAGRSSKVVLTLSDACSAAWRKQLSFSALEPHFKASFDSGWEDRFARMRAALSGEGGREAEVVVAGSGGEGVVTLRLPYHIGGNAVVWGSIRMTRVDGDGGRPALLREVAAELVRRACRGVASERSEAELVEKRIEVRRLREELEDTRRETERVRARLRRLDDVDDDGAAAGNDDRNYGPDTSPSRAAARGPNKRRRARNLLNPRVAAHKRTRLVDDEVLEDSSEEEEVV